MQGLKKTPWQRCKTKPAQGFPRAGFACLKNHLLLYDLQYFSGSVGRTLLLAAQHVQFAFAVFPETFHVIPDARGGGIAEIQLFERPELTTGSCHVNIALLKQGIKTQKSSWEDQSATEYVLL